MSKIQLTLLIGLPGSGKTSLCRGILHGKSEKNVEVSMNYIHVCYDKQITVSQLEGFVGRAKLMENLEIGDKVPILDSIDNQDPIKDSDGDRISENTMNGAIVNEVSLNSFEDSVGSEVSFFKDARSEVLLKVDRLMEFISKTETLLRKELQEFVDLCGFECALGHTNFDCSSFVFLIDDNFYYSSMRHEYFLLAAKHRASFSMIFMDISADDSKAVNLSRTGQDRVKNDVIDMMHSRLEKPSVAKNKWEGPCLTIHLSHSHKCTDSICCASQKCAKLVDFLVSEDGFDSETAENNVRSGGNVLNTVGYSQMCVCSPRDSTVESLQNVQIRKILSELFAVSFARPVLDRDVLAELREKTELSRQICAENLAHRSDLILREMVKQCLSSVAKDEDYDACYYYRDHHKCSEASCTSDLSNTVEANRINYEVKGSESSKSSLEESSGTNDLEASCTSGVATAVEVNRISSEIEGSESFPEEELSGTNNCSVVNKSARSCILRSFNGRLYDKKVRAKLVNSARQNALKLMKKIELGENLLKNYVERLFVEELSNLLMNNAR